MFQALIGGMKFFTAFSECRTARNRCMQFGEIPRIRKILDGKGWPPQAKGACGTRSTKPFET
jgi:hypothetical protein